MEEIPAELILNWDLIPSSTWTMSTHGSQQVEIARVNDKRQITVVFCGSIVGDFLPIQLIYIRVRLSECHPCSLRWTGTSHILQTNGVMKPR